MNKLKPCPFCGGEAKITEVDSFALDIINRQKAEIEKLKKQGEFRTVYMGHFPKLERDKAIKEFAERLKAELTTGVGCMRVSTIVVIDSLVKEMTEAKNETGND